MTLLQTYLIGMIGFTGGLSLAMSGTSNIRVSAVSPPRLQKVTWSAVTCGGKSVMLSIFTIPVFYTPNTRQVPSDCYRFPTPPPPIWNSLLRLGEYGINIHPVLKGHCHEIFVKNEKPKDMF